MMSHLAAYGASGPECQFTIWAVQGRVLLSNWLERRGHFCMIQCICVRAKTLSVNYCENTGTGLTYLSTCASRARHRSREDLHHDDD